MTKDGKYQFGALIGIALAVVFAAVFASGGAGLDPLVAQGVTNFDQLALSAASTDSVLEVNQTSTGNLVDFQDGGTSAFTIADGGAITMTGTLDFNGTADVVILDADADTTLSAPTDDQIDIEVSATDVGQWTASGLVKGSYFTVSFEAADTAISATQDPIFTWQMPFAATLIECSGVIRIVDRADADETYAFALEDDGSAITSAWAVSVSNTADLCTVDTAAVADNSVMEVTLTLGGTSPSAEDAYVVFTFQR